MPGWSAGILLYRWTANETGVEALIVHPGGPYWAKRDEGAWSIPKGEFDPANEDPLTAAAREFSEELGHEAPDAPWLDVGETRLPSGKRITAWAVEGDLDAASIESNTFELEWPPRSGRHIEVPEVDAARWVDPGEAARLLHPAQVCFVDRLLEGLDAS